MTKSNRSISTKAPIPKPIGALIVFTDVKGSTKHDEDALETANGNPAAVRSAKIKMLALRRKLFAEQIRCLPKSRWVILKNVGDALVLSADVPPPPNTIELVNTCIGDLYKAWKQLADKKIDIRVAVHFANASEIVSGGKLSKQLARSLKGLGDITLNAFLESLKFDMFGPGINRSARLAGAPSGPLFVVSDQTIELLNIRDKETATKTTQLIPHALIPTETVMFRGPIPLVKVKGVETVGFGHLRKGAKPWLIWELYEPSLNHRDSFGAENKRFQVIRIIQAVFKDIKSLANRNAKTNNADLPDTFFGSHLRKWDCFKFFFDLMLEVKEVWSFYTPSDNRDFEMQKAPKLTSLTKHMSRFLPYYISINSAPNEATDAVLRNAIVKFPGNKKNDFEFEAISYHVHGGVRFVKNMDMKKATGARMHLFLLFFQVRHDALKIAASPSKFFANVPKSITENSYSWKVCMFGLLRGDKDGFLLLSLSSNESVSAMSKSFERYLKNQSQANAQGTFFRQIAPIKIFLCHSQSSMLDTNLTWLKECAYGFKASAI